MAFSRQKSAVFRYQVGTLEQTLPSSPPCPSCQIGREIERLFFSFFNLLDSRGGATPRESFLSFLFFFRHSKDEVGSQGDLFSFPSPPGFSKRTSSAASFSWCCQQTSLPFFSVPTGGRKSGRGGFFPLLSFLSDRDAERSTFFLQEVGCPMNEAAPLFLPFSYSVRQVAVNPRPGVSSFFSLLRFQLNRAVGPPEAANQAKRLPLRRRR